MADTLLELGNRTNPTLQALKVIGGAALLLAAAGATWTGLSGRVAAAEHQIEAHGAELKQQREEMKVLKEDVRRSGWNLYIVCKHQAPGADCQPPPERP